MTRFHHQTLAGDVLSFWFAPKNRDFWFRKSAAFDAEIRSRFHAAHAAATAGALDAMRAAPREALALVILLDQFSRNLNRKSAAAFAADDAARRLSDEAIARRFDMIADDKARGFFYLPFMHSESIADQERSVALYKARLPAAGSNLRYALLHRDVVARFGRFPHRNAALGRMSTPAEIAFLKAGGFSG